VEPYLFQAMVDQLGRLLPQAVASFQGDGGNKYYETDLAGIRQTKSCLQDLARAAGSVIQRENRIALRDYLLYEEKGSGRSSYQCQRGGSQGPSRRPTRLAAKVLLAEMGLNTFNLFSFENYYNKNITKYFQTVGEFGNYYELVNKINFTSWLEYFTEGIIDELLRVQKTLPEVGISPETNLQPHHLKILEFIKEKGFIADRDYAKLVGRAKATRALDFKKLIELELISRKGKGKATYYVLKEK